MAAEKLLSIKQVKDLTTLSKTHIYRLMARDEFPQQVKLGNRVAWLECEINEYIQKHIQASRENANAA